MKAVAVASVLAILGADGGCAESGSTLRSSFLVGVRRPPIYSFGMSEPLILVKDIDEEMKSEYVSLIADGLDPGTAARELGSTGSQFRKLRSPQSQWYDPAFADQVATAVSSDGRRRNRLERLEEAFWSAVESGEKWAIEKGLLVYHPEFEKLRHTNLRVSGEIIHAAKVLLPHLSDEELEARISAIESREGPRLLDAPKDEAA